jgi:hypothetical protein
MNVSLSKNVQTTSWERLFFSAVASGGTPHPIVENFCSVERESNRVGKATPEMRTFIGERNHLLGSKKLSLREKWFHLSTYNDSSGIFWDTNIVFFLQMRLLFNNYH